jgi:hypothetical protein
MNRRQFLGTGAIVSVGLLAGCASDDPSSPTTEQGETTTDAGTPVGGGATDGQLSVQVTPSASSIQWGEDYSVTVTLEAGSDVEYDWAFTEIYYQIEGDTNWIGVATDSSWDLQPGSPQTKTYEIDPPATGEIAFRLYEDMIAGETVAEWSLTVEPPVREFGQAIPYYDGLAVTVDARITDTIDFHVYDSYGGEDLGVYAVQPNDGRWAIAAVAVENTNANQEVRPPHSGNLALLASGTQLEVVDGLLFVDGPAFSVVGDAPADAYVVDVSSEPGFFDPPNFVVPTATTRGWVPFLLHTDATADELAAVMTREDVRARWE